MRGYLLLLLLLGATASSIYGDELPSLRLSADTADYDGNEIRLTGHVVAIHPEVTLRSGTARAYPEGSTTSLNSIKRLELSNRISIELKDGSTLTAWAASIDQMEGRAEFQSFLPLERVIYSKNEGERPTRLECNQLAVKLKRGLKMASNSSGEGSAESLLPSDQELSSIAAEGSVRVAYGKELTVESSALSYERSDHLALSATGEPYDALTLQGEIHLSHKRLGELYANDKLLITRSLLHGKPAPSQLFSFGETHLISTPTDKELPHHLVCHGPCFVDLENGIARLGSLCTVGADSSPADEGRVLYSDASGSFNANGAIITFSFDENRKAQLEHVSLRGNVRIQHLLPGSSANFSLQYALAEEADYSVSSEELTLVAETGGRVLFIDDENKTRVSAQKVVINRASGSVKGFGGVRFTLTEGEILALRELLSQP